MMVVAASLPSVSFWHRRKSNGNERKKEKKRKTFWWNRASFSILARGNDADENDFHGRAKCFRAPTEKLRMSSWTTPYMRKGQKLWLYTRTFQLVITGGSTVGARPCRVVAAFPLPPPGPAPGPHSLGTTQSNSSKSLVLVIPYFFLSQIQLWCLCVRVVPERETMAVVVRITSVGGADRSSTCFSSLTWLLLWLALLMDGNVRLVSSQFIFREDPLGRKRYRHRLRFSIVFSQTFFVFIHFGFKVEKKKFRENFKKKIFLFPSSKFSLVPRQSVCRVCNGYGLVDCVLTRPALPESQVLYRAARALVLFRFFSFFLFAGSLWKFFWPNVLVRRPKTFHIPPPNLKKKKKRKNTLYPFYFFYSPTFVSLSVCESFSQRNFSCVVILFILFFLSNEWNCWRVQRHGRHSF